MLFNATGDRLVGTLVDTSQIDSFAVLPDGRLRAAPGSPFTGQGLGQIGAEFRPANPSQLFVTNAHNGAGLGTVSAFSDNFLGQLSPIGSSPYADFQTAPCWVEISHDGQYLFAVNTGSANISSYSINPDGSLVLIGSTAITGGGADIDARLSPDGKYLPGRRLRHAFRVRVRRERRHPHRAAQLPDAAAQGLPGRDRQHLGTTSRLPASCPWPARRAGQGQPSLVVPHPRAAAGPLPCDTGYAASYVVERQPAVPWPASAGRPRGR